MADLMVFLMHNDIPVTLHVECKSTTGALRPSQIEWRDKLKKVGHGDYHIVRSIDDLVRVLESYGISISR